DTACGRERQRLRLEALSGQHAAAGRAHRIEPDPLEVARELLDGVDRRDPLDLHGHPLAVRIAAHEVDRPDVGRPLAPDEAQLLAERMRLRGELLLEVALDAVLLEPRGLAHLVPDVAQDLGDANLEPVLGAARALADDD